MKQSLKVLSITAALALTAIAQAAYATPTADPRAPSSATKAMEEDSSLSGKVVETMDAGGYTYVLLENKGIKTWVAVPLMKVTVGQAVSFQPGQEMVNFKSRTLNRTFERILFSGGPVKQEAANEEAVKNAHGGKSLDELKGKEAPSIAPKTPVVENVKVEKATGSNAYSIAELYEKGGTLEKQKVVVKGKVVKVSSGIMGKTWVHLRDGSGSAEQKTNDLVVTSQDVPAVGDVVTASGTLYKDKDFGAGYVYSLIIEEASLKK
ncbi:MAG TPA: DNA-binding protein [Geobacteraceae bacterium]|jgi:hypothetical protein|nr:DNA-binding protein [Geobacteraceae bacterium]